MDLKNLSDLHIHLGSTQTPHFLWELAHKQGIRVVEKEYWKFIDLVTVKKNIPSKQYLKKIDRAENDAPSPFEITHKIQSSPIAVEECVHRAISDAYLKGSMDLIELRFNPMFRTKNGEYDLDKIIFGATTGLRRAMIEYPIKAGLILESDRQFTEKQHMIIVEKAVEFMNYGVVGVDVSGPSPDNFSVRSFAKAAELARSNGLGVTYHTGEFSSAEEVDEVLGVIKPKRIGHGIKASSHPKILEKIREQKIYLELCPTSNVMTGVVNDWDEMGTIIRIFLDNGIMITVNSDGPEFFNTNVKKELETLLDMKIISEKEAATIIKNGHDASFIK